MDSLSVKPLVMMQTGRNWVSDNIHLFLLDISFWYLLSNSLRAVHGYEGAVFNEIPGSFFVPTTQGMLRSRAMIAA